MRIGVIGLGLIGGSFALGVKRAMPNAALLGNDRDEASVEVALKRGIIDAAADWAELGACDVTMIAVPVRQLFGVFKSLAPHLSATTVLTDAGSTKGAVVDAARAALGHHIGQFVPGHPIAGREKSGANAAAGELFEGRHVVLTPLAENAVGSIARVESLWKSCGASV
ncbi:MAG: prephenate dehydrogenase/arogenate dehydrogenase family protein, partial [Betaproteobacteria bacterium]|nr:prephenate dehydrogenase/arogenate dehydrogenase family protein [Betaproteobacteria bacterium]